MAKVEIGRDDDGTIRITSGPDSGSDVLRAVLDVAGASLSWPDVTDLGLPNAEVHNVSQAQQWLWAFYGERVATAVHAGTGAVRVEADDTELAHDAARLAYGHWAARWWPASYLDEIPALDPDLLGLELAAQTYRCHQLFDDSPDDLVAELIETHEAALDPLIQWWQAAPEVTGEVLRLIDAAADSVGLDSEPLQRLRSALDQPPVSSSVDPAVLFAGQADFALAAGDPGTTGRVIAKGSGINDWRRYPPGFVDAAENAVSWIARALGARRQLEISASAGELSPADGITLAAEVRVNGGESNRIALARREDLWTGRTDLAGSPTRFEVGILLPGFDPGVGDDGRADREAARALARQRLAGAVEPWLAEIVAIEGSR